MFQKSINYKVFLILNKNVISSDKSKGQRTKFQLFCAILYYETDLEYFDESVRRDVVGLDIQLLQGRVWLEGGREGDGGVVRHGAVGHGQLDRRLVVAQSVEDLHELLLGHHNVVQIDGFGRSIVIA